MPKCTPTLMSFFDTILFVEIMSIWVSNIRSDLMNVLMHLILLFSTFYWQQLSIYLRCTQIPPFFLPNYVLTKPMPSFTLHCRLQNVGCGFFLPWTLLCLRENTCTADVAARQEGQKLHCPTHPLGILFKINRKKILCIGTQAAPPFQGLTFHK